MKKSILTIGLLTTIMGSMLCITADSGQQATPLVSRGWVTLTNGSDSVNIDSSDLYSLRTALNNLEEKYDQGIKESLSNIGTNITVENPTFDELMYGIVHSQDVSTGTTADNLTLGEEAWVNGKKIVGTGVDNDAFYNKGFVDGQATSLNALDVQYTYHEHVDGNNNKINSNAILTVKGGCATTGFHNHSSSCYRTCKVTKKVGYITPPGADGNASTVYHMVEDHGGCGRATSVYSCLSDESATYTHQYTICGSPINAYKIGCGKTEQTIESATIVFK